MKIVWSPTAKSKIKEILEYVAGDNLYAALNLIEQFESTVERLKASPELGRVLPELENVKIRELVVHKNYGVIYEINPESIEILTVRHFRQNFSSPKL